MNKRDKDKRFAALREIGCITCLIDGKGLQCGKVEVHHLNSFSLAGHKRLGDEFTIPLGVWAHRGVPPIGMTSAQAGKLYGPSLSLSKRMFHMTYGEDAVLLQLTNEKLKAVA